METNCAVCRLSDGLVLNIIVASPSDPAPNGCQLVEIMTGQSCNVGWHYALGVFNGLHNHAMCAEGSNEVVSFVSASYVGPTPTAPAGYYTIEVPQGVGCGIGWTWDGDTFNPPVG